MEWLKKINNNINEDIQSEHFENFSIKELPIENDADLRVYSIISQFLLFQSSQFHPSVTYFHLPTKEIDDALLREAILHFDQRKVLMVEGKPINVMVSDPNPESLEYLRSNDMNPIVKSLFKKDDRMIEQGSSEPQNPYKVDPCHIDIYDNNEFDEVLDFLERTVDGEPICINVYNWVLNDSLKDNLAIRYLAHKYREMYLWINNSNEVTVIQLKNRL